MAKKEKYLKNKRPDPIPNQYENSLVELLDIFVITQQGCDAIFEKHSEDTENQLWRRLFIKTLYSHFEAVCFCMKQTAYFVWVEYEGGKLSFAEIAMLLEDSYCLDDKGNAKKGDAHLKSQWNLHFAFKMFAHATGNKKFTLEKGREGWDCYLKGVKIRNRITHPKNVKALTITDEEMEKVKKALEWFRKEFDQLMKIRKIKHVKR